MEWQPIETAPKNNKEVLVFVPGHNPPVFTAAVIGGDWCYSVSDRYSPEDGFYSDPPLHPTHWMPLPEPPKSKRESESWDKGGG